jgi:hypothetical protein
MRLLYNIDNPEDIFMIDPAALYLQGMSIAKVSSITGISKSCLQRKFKKLGINRSNKQNSRKYNLNHNYFHIINSEEKAYWLGFLFADGYITHSKYNQKYIGLNLSVKDISHLEKFKKAITATYPIKCYNYPLMGYSGIYAARLLMTSDQMFDDLNAKGVVLRKSLILQFPKFLSPKLINHFIRGYFDGDGSVIRSNQNGKIVCQLAICGTKEFLNVLCQYLPCDQQKLRKRHKDMKNNYFLHIRGNLQVKKTIEYIYQNATIFLDRKLEKYQNITGFSPISKMPINHYNHLF